MRMLGSTLALVLLTATLGAWRIPSAAAQEPGAFANALLFDSTNQEIKGEPGQADFTFSFAFTNSAPVAVIIESVRTSCGCTVAKVPPLPWTIPPGERGEFSVALDARGKSGRVTKSVFLNTSIGIRPLTVHALVGGEDGKTMDADDRLRNIQVALADRFAVFRGECATCHAQPARNRTGPALYLAACAVCHDSVNRASLVPDLKRLPHPADRDHWLRWITFGRHGSLMPAFSEYEGGILTEAQIDSLADYLTRALGGRRQRTAAADLPLGSPAPVTTPAPAGGLSESPIQGQP